MASKDGEFSGFTVSKNTHTPIGNILKKKKTPHPDSRIFMELLK
jgi:hypothetical protein